MYKLEVKESVTNLPEGVNKSLCPTNAFRIHCDTTGNLQSYTLCQHIVKAKKEKRLGKSGMFKECSCALDNIACPALLMMLTEYKAGRIMFYDHYDPSIENYPARPMAQQSTLKRSWFSSKMLIAKTKVEDVKSTSKPLKPELPDDIYKTAMMDAYKQENEPINKTLCSN